MARPPKPKEVRLNHAKPRTGEWFEIPVKPLPGPAHEALSAFGTRKWQPESRQRWDVWRHDATSLYWSPADVDYAIETLTLYEVPEPNWAEISRRRDRLGLTPKGKRDLRLLVVTTEKKAAAEKIPEESGSGRSQPR